MKLSKDQELFLELVEKRENIFLTGKAGTGKSFVTKEAISLLKKCIVVAPTGIAATNIGGQTIHSLFGVNPAGVCTFETCNFLKSEKRKLLTEAETIIIDEVSMVRADLLDAIEWTLMKNGCGSLKTKQVIFIGDMKQLPPIADDNFKSVMFRDYDGVEFFNSKIYKQLKVIEVELSEVLRQNDPEFIEALNIVREGGKSPYFKKFVKNEVKGVVLAPYNNTVEKYNNDGLDSLPGELHTFKSNVQGKAKASDFNLEPILKVKDGAKIMYLVNSKCGNLVNGTIGNFEVINGRYFIIVNGIDYPIEKVEIVKKEYVLNEGQDDFKLEVVGSIEQYPIKLAYAMSIHKSQGLTLDEVTVDLTRPCFHKSQLYVALSRVKTPEGLTIKI